MEPVEYVEAVRDRLASSGYQIKPPMPDGAALTGYRSDFRLQWFATKLHLFVTIQEKPSASMPDLWLFTRQALDAAKRAKGRLRGWQSGVAVIAVTVAQNVDTSAGMYAEEELLRQFAAFAWPVAVDLTTGRRFEHRGNPRIGAIYTRWMGRQIATVLPDAPV